MSPDTARLIEQEFTKYPTRSYPKGQILLFAGENPDCVYFLAKGKVRKYDVSYRGDEVVVNIFKPPSFFPMSWLINRTTNHYFYKTEAPTQIYVIPTADALRFIKTHPKVMLEFLSIMYAVVNGLQGRIVQLMAGTAKSRIVYELIVECRRFGVKDSDGNYLLSTNESDIAARSGLSRETVSREMRNLKERGTVKITKGAILVRDLHALEKQFGNPISIV